MHEFFLKCASLLEPIKGLTALSWPHWKSVGIHSREVGEMESGQVWWCQALGHKLMHRKFHLNRRIKFLTGRVSEYWNTLPRENVESLTEHIQELSRRSPEPWALGQNRL